MLSQRTLIITGAGASKNYDFPLGPELNNKIIQKLQDEQFKERIWFEYKIKPEDSTSFLKQFANSDCPSIDYFINDNPNYKRLSMVIISLILLEHEKKFIKILNQTNIITSEKKWEGDHWLQYLWRKIYSYARTQPNWPLRFLTFNYDRTIEEYFADKMFYKFGLESLLDKYIKVTHINGTYGIHPRATASGNFIKFGSDEESDLISKNCDGMQFFTDECDIKDSINDDLEWAEKILIFGYNFDRSNNLKIFTKENLIHYHEKTIASFFHDTMEHSDRVRANNFFHDSLGHKYFNGHGNKNISEFLSNSLSLQ